jgi:choline dehydrogenase-like flavoprotein
MNQWLDHGETSYRDSGRLEGQEAGSNNSGKGVGGGSVHWAAFVPRFHPSDFEVYTQDGLGANWPISYEDIEPYYQLLEREMPVAGPAYFLGENHMAILTARIQWVRSAMCSLHRDWHPCLCRRPRRDPPLTNSLAIARPNPDEEPVMTTLKFGCTSRLQSMPFKMLDAGRVMLNSI